MIELRYLKPTNQRRIDMRIAYVKSAIAQLGQKAASAPEVYFCGL